MKELIKVIAFDADDTLWSNEPFFQEVEKQYTDLLKPYGTSKEISAALFQTEMNKAAEISLEVPYGFSKSWDMAPRRLPFQWSKQHYRSATERLQPTLFGKLSI